MKVTEQQKQPVDINRKLVLRKTLMEKAGSLSGAFYVPFIGDGDIAVELYQGHKIYGADLDSERVATAKSRLPDAEIIQADCDAFPFRGRDIEYSLADFDPYAYPYKAFREFWQQARLTSPFVCFFTDGEKQAIMRNGHWTMPDGKKNFLKGADARRVVFNKYWTGTILPWFTEYIKPWRIVETFKYSRKMEFYWGAIIENPNVQNSKTEKRERTPYKFDEVKREEYLKLLRLGEPRLIAAGKVGLDSKTPDRFAKRYSMFAEAVSRAEMEGSTHRNISVENALYEAAISGNVTAAQVWLYNRSPERWADKRNISVVGKDGGPVRVEVDAKEKLLQILDTIAKRSLPDATK